MSEWWTYTLSDLLMFSARTYYRLFELHNLAIWPGQLIVAAAGLAILVCAARAGATAARIASGLLAACWLWVAWAFLAQRYAQVNWAADYFAVGFAIQAVLLLWYGVVRGQLSLTPIRSRIDRAGFGLLLFAVACYPLLALASGRAWRQMEIFGMAPDPTAIATLGLLLLVARPRRTLLLMLGLIPLLWCAISGATLWTLQAADAWVLPLLSMLALVLLVARASTQNGTGLRTRA